MTSRVNMKVFPAKGGDSILISIDCAKYNILVDSGYGSTYEIIKNELKNPIYKKLLDMLIITHIDADHILGGVEFLKDNNSNNLIKINEILFNGYRQILGEKELQDNPDVNYKCKMAEINSVKETTSEEFECESLADVGYSEGESFSNLLQEKVYDINRNFPNGVFKKENINENIINISSDIKIIIITPARAKLKNLLDEWENYLNCEGIKHVICKDSEKGFENYILSSDNFTESLDDVSNNIFDIETLAKKNVSSKKTTTNESSIGFILIVDKKKYIFPGDAYADDILDSLEDLLKANLIQDMSFELLKVSHHGSKYNISDNLLKRISCNNYIISTNGAHNHPDKETIAKIIAHNNECNIYFNYKLTLIDEIEKAKTSDYGFNIISVDGDIDEILEINL